MPIEHGAVRKVLANISSTRDSVQLASKWIMEHKHEVDIITKVWFELYKDATDDLKVALIYVMNDSVQMAKHEKDRSVPIAFHPHVVNAITLASETVKKPIKRCLEVFTERHIYPDHVISEMKAALDGATDAAEGEDVLNMDIDQFCKRLEHYSDACNSLDKARKILDSINFDIESNDVRTKSKRGVIELENEAELMIEKLQKFIASIEAQYNRTLKIKQLNQKASKYYSNQIKDVTIVHDAYDRFAKGIASTRSVLENILQTGVLPGQTPPEAPSPTPSEDMIDTTEDMQMDEEDKPVSTNPQSALISPQDYIPFPRSSDVPSSFQGPSSSTASSSTKADPRKIRTSLPATMPFLQLPSLPPELVSMLPSGKIPSFFQQTSPFPTTFSGSNELSPSVVNSSTSSRKRSVESQDSGQNMPCAPGTSNIPERQSWKVSDESEDFNQPNFSSQAPSYELQNLQFASPSKPTPLSDQLVQPQQPPPASSFFPSQPTRSRFSSPRGSPRFFSPRGDRSTFFANQQWDNQQNAHSKFQADGPNRRRVSDFVQKTWQQPNKRGRSGKN